MNIMAMHPIYYSGFNDLPGALSVSQGGPNGHDTSMTGMLEDANMLADFDGLPLTVDVNNLEGGNGQKSYTSLGATISQNDMEPTDEKENPDPNSSEKHTGVGAGPLPTGFGLHSALGGGSLLTEFTKRRNWSQLVVEELKDFLHILTPDGRIVYTSSSAKQLTDYPQEELVGKFIVDFIHPDDSGIFVREFNESITSGHPLRFFYRFRKKDGTYTIFESHGHPHLTSEAAAFGPNNAAGFCRGFFMMARPYPTKNAGLLDSFLEHKIENARLMKRIEELKREEADEAANPVGSQWGAKKGSENPSDETDTIGGSSVINSVSAVFKQGGSVIMPPPARPLVLSNALTRQNLEDATATNKPDSMADKMDRYHMVEMHTGLRYQDGERSQGISTGDQSPALIRGDAGIAIAADKEARANDKRKKIKLPDEYVCTDCGTLDSPEWRKGPSGPKTLCNACGLRWAKKEKKKPSPTDQAIPQPSASNGS